MPRKKKRRSQPEYKHAFLAIRVEKYEARIEAGIHHYASEPHYAWHDIDDDPLFEFTTHLEITGTCTYPEDRAGDAYEVTIRSEPAESSRVYAKVKDVHVRDERGVPQYREYRGKSVPIYRPPEGVGRLSKVHGEPKYTAWVFAMPRFVSDCLALLGQERAVYLSMTERRRRRDRWLYRLSLQTTDPAEE